MAADGKRILYKFAVPPSTTRADLGLGVRVRTLPPVATDTVNRGSDAACTSAQAVVGAIPKRHLSGLHGGGALTGDVGGKASTTEFTDAVIGHLG
jgi:hypothetical protein